VTGVAVERGDGAARTRAVIRADVVFVCCGAVQTAALLRRSGITRNVGDNLCIHPMIKAAAVFDEEIGAHEETLPIYQVKEFWPNIAIGGSVFTPGFLAMLLADNWKANQHVMQDWSRMALYYAGTRGMNRGTIRVLPGVADGVVVRYRLTEADRRNLSDGLAHLGEILFAAGATAVYASQRAQPVLKSVDQCRGFLKQPIPVTAMSLSTVHAFSSCPMGENPDLCATDSFGRVNGFRNLHINDASIIPDSPSFPIRRG
jgi:choline dehydrogenase-like flavoprotein